MCSFHDKESLFPILLSLWWRIYQNVDQAHLFFPGHAINVWTWNRLKKFHFARLVKTEFEELSQFTWMWQIGHNLPLSRDAMLSSCTVWYVNEWGILLPSRESAETLMLHLNFLFIFSCCCEMRAAQAEVLTVHSQEFIDNCCPICLHGKSVWVGAQPACMTSESTMCAD